MNRRFVLAGMGIIASVLFLTPQVMGQTRNQVNAILTIQPFPSPYASDWQRNPSIATLAVTNETKTPLQVIASLVISTSSGTRIVTGSSGIIALLPGANILNNTSILRGNLSYFSTGLQVQIAQTGRIPEGSYDACLSISDVAGNVLAQNVCASFTIVYPDPPHLVFPSNGDTVSMSYPIFQWTPLQVPIQYQLHYVLKVVEVLPGQNINQAIAANIPQYTNENLLTPTLQYPVNALPLKSGSIYAWQVQALDQNGFSPASNYGKSEIWTFAYTNSSMIVLHPIFPPSPPVSPFHYIFLTSSTVDGSLYGTFTPPSTGMIIPNKPSAGKTFPLANTTVELVAKYMLVENSGNTTIHHRAPAVEISVPRNKLPSDHKYDDADEAIATTTTDPSGNFSFSFLQTDSTGLIAKNQTINFLGGDLSNYQTGDLYKVYRIMVQSPYYLSPASDIMVQPYQTDDVGSLPAMLRNYNLTIKVVHYFKSSQLPDYTGSFKRGGCLHLEAKQASWSS